MTAGEVHAEGWPDGEWPAASAEEMGLDAAALDEARDFAIGKGGSGCVIYEGRMVCTWGDIKRRYDLKSSTKSIGGTVLGLALMDSKVQLDDRAAEILHDFGAPPKNNQETGWLDEITLFHLATQTAGFEKPGGFGRLLFKPGTKWSYSDGGPNWLADCLTHVYGRDLRDLLFERVFSRLGVAQDDLTWRDNAYRPQQLDGVARREFGSGISANVDAMARIGYLYLRGGRWRSEQLLPEAFVRAVAKTPASADGLPVVEPEHYGSASHHYGLLWWNNNDGALQELPRDAFWSWGLYDSLIVVIPTLDLVVTRAGRSFGDRGGDHYDVLRPFLTPIARAAATSKATSMGRSPVVARLTWAPASTVIRKADGSDNWPVAWGDDGFLYTAYGDGWGFAPRVERKLSLGLARVKGVPPDVTATNLRRPDIEQTGDGTSGKKASGMVMVKGVLYLWVRNADNAQLAFSKDRGATWAWCDWRFDTSFGHPAFLDAGKDYSDAQDGYAHIVSPDADSAYAPADDVALARVPVDEITSRDAYRFFGELRPDGRARWLEDIEQRGSILRNSGKCYRSSLSYHPVRNRYLLCMVYRAANETQRSGLAVFDAPHPWGPWSVTYEAAAWDLDPGESARFPTKWMSPDGRTMYLLFSGDDSFAVRRADMEFQPTSPDSR